jgi:hypothetical protein
MIALGLLAHFLKVLRGIRYAIGHGGGPLSCEKAQPTPSSSLWQSLEAQMSVAHDMSG